LGTSTSLEGKKYFSDLVKHQKQFAVCDAEDRSNIDLAFSKKKVDERKEWLRQFRPGTYMDHSTAEIRISDFIHKELILFSMADNIRSIPSLVDGLKPGQRKILFSCFKRNLKGEIKVAQLAGYVAEHSAYHHGEQSLCATIVNMAQNFVGSNNLNLLEPIGQFGTRIQGGKDAASPRYVFTTLLPTTRMIFHRDDDPLLSYQSEDSQQIEPDWYIPIVPMVLVNGSEGIGSGWSTSIPMYNPHDIVNNLYRLMENEPMAVMHPWYRNFKGTIEQIAADKYKATGIVRRRDERTIEIVELPVGVWTQNYKEFLESLMQKESSTLPFITDYKEYHTDTVVHFVISLTEENMRIAEEEGLEKRFKLSATICTSNMVCFDSEGRIKKYSTVEDILYEFYNLRLEFYQRRKVITIHVNMCARVL
jgi:DNA topoisomerase II